LTALRLSLSVEPGGSGDRLPDDFSFHMLQGHGHRAPAI
jgi:hypothetical protein